MAAKSTKSAPSGGRELTTALPIAMGVDPGPVAAFAVAICAIGVAALAVGVACAGSHGLDGAMRSAAMSFEKSAPTSLSA